MSLTHIYFRRQESIIQGESLDQQLETSCKLTEVTALVHHHQMHQIKGHVSTKPCSILQTVVGTGLPVNPPKNPLQTM